MNPIRRVLFIRTDRIGDALMNLPAIRRLRLSYPKAWIALLAGPQAVELFQGHPDLDEVFAADPETLASLRGRAALWRKLRAAKFDLAVVSNPSKFLHFLVWAAGVGIRAGHGRKGAFFLNRRLPPREALMGLHEIDRNLRLAGLVCEKEWDGEMVLPADPGAARRVREKLAPVLERSGSVVAVHTGTSHPKKRWAAARFGELCRRTLEDPGRAVVLVGSREEKDAAREVARLAPGAEDWTGETSLRDLAAFFAHPRVSALVSSDSGPVHVAWIAGTPVVALYAMDLPGSDPMRWGPRDGASEAIHKPMAEISVDEVQAALRRVLLHPGRKGEGA